MGFKITGSKLAVLVAALTSINVSFAQVEGGIAGKPGAADAGSMDTADIEGKPGATGEEGEDIPDGASAGLPGKPGAQRELTPEQRAEKEAYWAQQRAEKEAYWARVDAGQVTPGDTTDAPKAGEMPDADTDVAPPDEDVAEDGTEIAQGNPKSADSDESR